MLRSFISTILSRATNVGLTLLRNRSNLRLSREEFRFSRLSFSQFGEDLAVLRWLDERFPDAPTIYVDAGAFHPIHCSNTLLVKKRGWWGINIDMVTSKIDLFRRLRPDDFSVVKALFSSEAAEMKAQFGMGLTDRLLHSSAGNGQVWQTVRTTTLNDVLDSAPRPIDRIGYLNIDCEGADLEVLRGFDLERFAPAVITIEAHRGRLSETKDYLTRNGYELKEHLGFTLLFTRSLPSV